ncbi:hypothetical protein H5410_019843 [Solanum commersonii]|uniref:Uncharacterized protein n=1 Tax=Solanum commersonii TaxID=4109 RepID=A0A9J5Z7G8_SOLCO|nr:hypothetical protein H5410_019843 [Solanum commersonii]
MIIHPNGDGDGTGHISIYLAHYGASLLDSVCEVNASFSLIFDQTHDNFTVMKDVELPERYNPPKFEIFNGIRDPKAYLRMYCDKFVGVRKDEKVRMKLFMRSLTGKPYHGASNKTLANGSNGWTTNFMNRWRSEAARARPPIEKSQMKDYFIHAQESQYYNRMMLVAKKNFADIIKLGERIEEGIKNVTIMNLKDLQATNKALQSSVWKKVQTKDYFVVDQLSKIPPQISILSLLQSSKTHQNALMKVLGEAYVPVGITHVVVARMVGQVFKAYMISFHENELPLEGTSHNEALYISTQ